MKLRLLSLTVISISLSCFLFAAEQQEMRPSAFVQEIDGVGSLQATTRTSDGAYLTVSGGSRVITISKFSSEGNKIWTSSFENSSPGEIGIRSITEVSDGYLLAGGQGWYWTYYDGGILIKIDTSGKIVWSKQSNSLRYLSSITVQPDGTFLAVGVSSIPMSPALIKFSSDGSVLWKKKFSQFELLIDDWGFQNYYPASATTPDNGLVMVLREFNYVGPTLVYLLRINPDGEVLWNRKMKISGFASVLHVTSDGGILLISSDTNTVVRLNENGLPDWAASYPFASNRTFLTDAIERPEGGYELVGSRERYGTPQGLVEDGSAILLKIDGRGKIVSQKELSQGKTGYQQQIFLSPDNGYVAFTPKLRDGIESVLMWKVDSEGHIAGCNFSHVNELVKEKEAVEITRKFRLERPHPFSLKFGELTLSPHQTNYSIRTICD